MFRTTGEFEVGNGDNLVVGHTKTEKTYHICVRHAWDVVPLKVTHDNQVTTIGKGDCENITAKNISITPAKKMQRDMALSGWYRNLTEKHENTNG